MVNLAIDNQHTPPVWERPLVRLWDAHMLTAHVVGDIIQAQVSSRGGVKPETAVFTLPGDHVLAPQFQAVKTLPQVITVDVNGVHWAGMIQTAKRSQAPNGETRWVVTAVEVKQHLYRLQGKSPTQVGDGEKGAQEYRGQLANVFVDMVGSAARRTGLPVYTSLPPDIGSEWRLGHEVEIEARTEDSIGGLLEGNLGTWVVDAGVTPALRLHAATVVNMGGAERQWAKQWVEKYAEVGKTPQEFELLVQQATASGTPPGVLPDEFVTDASAALDVEGAPADGLVGLVWAPWDDTPPRAIDGVVASPGARVISSEGTLQAMTSQSQLMVMLGRFATYWQPGAFLNPSAGGAEAARVKELINHGRVFWHDGQQATGKEPAFTAPVAQRPAMWMWREGAKFILATQQHVDEEILPSMLPLDSTTVVPGVVFHLHPGRDRREVVFSTAAGGGLVGFEATITAPDAAQVIGATQWDEWARGVGGRSWQELTSSPDGDVSVNVKPGGVFQHANIGVGTMGAAFDIGRAGVLFYREAFENLGAAKTGADMAAALEQAWAKRQGGMAVTLTPTARDNVVFGDDVRRDGGTLWGWRIGDRVRFRDGDALLSEVVFGYELSWGAGQAFVARPVLGRSEDVANPMRGLAQRVRSVEAAAVRNHLAPPVRSDLVGKIDDAAAAAGAAAGAAADAAAKATALESSAQVSNSAVPLIPGGLRPVWSDGWTMLPRSQYGSFMAGLPAAIGEMYRCPVRETESLTRPVERYGGFVTVDASVEYTVSFWLRTENVDNAVRMFQFGMHNQNGESALVFGSTVRGDAQTITLAAVMDRQANVGAILPNGAPNEPRFVAADAGSTTWQRVETHVRFTPGTTAVRIPWVMAKATGVPVGWVWVAGFTITPRVPSESVVLAKAAADARAADQQAITTAVQQATSNATSAIATATGDLDRIRALTGQQSLLAWTGDWGQTSDERGSLITVHPTRITNTTGQGANNGMDTRVLSRLMTLTKGRVYRLRARGSGNGDMRLLFYIYANGRYKRSMFPAGEQKIVATPDGQQTTTTVNAWNENVNGEFNRLVNWVCDFTGDENEVRAVMYLYGQITVEFASLVDVTDVAGLQAEIDGQQNYAIATNAKAIEALNRADALHNQFQQQVSDWAGQPYLGSSFVPLFKHTTVPAWYQALVNFNHPQETRTVTHIRDDRNPAENSTIGTVTAVTPTWQQPMVRVATTRAISELNTVAVDDSIDYEVRFTAQSADTVARNVKFVLVDETGAQCVEPGTGLAYTSGNQPLRTSTLLVDMFVTSQAVQYRKVFRLKRGTRFIRISQVSATNCWLADLKIAPYIRPQAEIDAEQNDEISNLENELELLRTQLAELQPVVEQAGQRYEGLITSSTGTSIAHARDEDRQMFSLNANRQATALGNWTGFFTVMSTGGGPWHYRVPQEDGSRVYNLPPGANVVINYVRNKSVHRKASLSQPAAIRPASSGWVNAPNLRFTVKESGLHAVMVALTWRNAMYLPTYGVRLVNSAGAVIGAAQTATNIGPFFGHGPRRRSHLFKDVQAVKGNVIQVQVYANTNTAFAREYANAVMNIDYLEL